MSIQNVCLLLHFEELIYELHENWHTDKSDMQIFHEAFKNTNTKYSVKV
jgi:hypothetical protein